jgi:hypothetical protein
LKKRKLENPLIDAIEKRASNERFAIFMTIALVVSGSAIAVLSKTHCKQKQHPNTAPQLKICTPGEYAKVKQVLQKGRQATGKEVKIVLSELDAILDMHLDCGWESVKELQADLSSRRQP